MTSRPVGGWRLASLLAAIIILTDMFIYRIPWRVCHILRTHYFTRRHASIIQIRGKCAAWLSIQAFAKWLYFARHPVASATLVA